MTTVPQNSSRVKRRKDGPPLILRGKLTRARTGVLYERSILLDKATAYTFSKAMRARPDITTAQVRRDHCVQGTPKRWYVRWLRAPVPLSLNTSLRSMQDMRAQRATEQACEMEFLQNDDKPGWYWCIHTYPDSDGQCGVYLTHPAQGCTCPDFQYRCDATGLRDKHQLALCAFLGLPVFTLESAIAELRPAGETRDAARARRQEAMAWEF